LSFDIGLGVASSMRQDNIMRVRFSAFGLSLKVLKCSKISRWCTIPASVRERHWLLAVVAQAILYLEKMLSPAL
jgi:hypothetical protein